MTPWRRWPRSLVLLLALSVALAAIRTWAMFAVGFGDSEALYASYALHPQPAYLDHPGLVGWLARLLGHGSAPTPMAAHAWGTLIATSVPWLAAAAARAFGAAWDNAGKAGLVLAVVPETAVGLFAMTPDSLLCPLWLLSLSFAARGSRDRDTVTGATCLLLAGALAGVAATAKVSGALLWLSLALYFASQRQRSVWAWAGLGCGALVALPVALFEWRMGFPMFTHRLVSTQTDAGISMRNLGMLTLGQLAYLSPLVAWAACITFRRLYRARRSDEARLLWIACVVPGIVLVPLCLWSRVAEPHWMAPALLSPLLFFARDPQVIRAHLRKWAGILAFVCTLGAHIWVLVPIGARFVPERDMRFDIANELYGWPLAIAALQRHTAEKQGETRGDVVVVGPHWTICAQAHAALGRGIPVGCLAPGADFERWQPRSTWQNAERLVWISDRRFDVDPARLFPERHTVHDERVPIIRAGREVRTFRIVVLERKAVAAIPREPR